MNKQMTPAQIELVHQSFDLLTHEVSDEALEAAGKNEARNFTMAATVFALRESQLDCVFWNVG